MREDAFYWNNSFGGYTETDIGGTLKAAGGDYGGGTETIIVEERTTEPKADTRNVSGVRGGVVRDWKRTG